MARIIDELKTIKQEIDSVSAAQSIMQYFDEMDLDDDEKNKRIAVATDFQRFFMNLFLLLATEEVSREYVINRISEEYVRILDRYDLRPNMGHIDRLAETIADNTLANLDKEYYTSVDRSVKIAETETNNSSNYEELQEAIDSGFTQKTWITMKDNKVRNTHVALDGATIGIDEFFHVGEAEMLYPCDEINGFNYPEELNGCRCTISYS